MPEHWLSSALLRPFISKAQDGPFQLPGALHDRSRVLAVDTGDLTELLFHVPLLNGLSRLYQKLRVDFLLPEAHTALVIPSGLANKCVVYNARQTRSWTPAYWSLLRSLRKNDYDLSVVMSSDPQPRLELAGMASGAALRMGPSHAHAYPAVNFELKPSRERSVYRGLRPLRAASFLGLDEKALDRRWPLPTDKLRRAQQLVHFNKPRKDELLVGVDPGLGKSGHGISLQNLNFLVKQLTSQMSCRVLPLGDTENQERLHKFEAQLSGPPIGLPRDTLLDTILLLTQCDLFVAGNTDLFHFAVALAVPTIGLFTQVDGPQWDPGPRMLLRILKITKGQRVDIDTLMEAVESVTTPSAHGTQEPLTSIESGREPS